MKSKNISKYIVCALVFCFVMQPLTAGHFLHTFQMSGHTHSAHCSHGLAFAGLFDAMSIQDERELGEKYNVIMKTLAPLAFDPFVQDYLQDMVDKILENASPQPFEYEVNLMLDPSLNAFASPGGLLFVNSGLFVAMESESELAAVVSHEVAHVTQRHIAERQGKSTATMLATLATALAAAIVGTAIDSGGATTEAAISGGIAAMYSAMLSYSREDETEADNVGFEFFLASGYDPYSYPEAFRKLQGQFGFGGNAPTYLSTHPDLNARISGIDARILAQKAVKKHDDNKRFFAVQSFIRAKYTDINSALLYFSKQDKKDPFVIFSNALLYSRKHDVKKAEEAFEKALQIQANNWLFLREYAYFNYQYGSINKAYELASKSYKLQPYDLMTAFYMGRILEDLGRLSEATRYYEQVLDTYPHDSQVHRHLAQSYGRSGYSFKAYLHLAYASLYKEDFTKAKKYAADAKKYKSSAQDEEELTEYDRAYDFYYAALHSS